MKEMYNVSTDIKINRKPIEVGTHIDTRDPKFVDLICVSKHPSIYHHQKSVCLALLIL